MHSIHNKIEQIKATSEISDVLLSQLDKHITKEGERFKIKNKTKLNIKDSWMHKMIEEFSYADWNEVPKFYDPEIILNKIQNLEGALKVKDFNELTVISESYDSMHAQNRDQPYLLNLAIEAIEEKIPALSQYKTLLLKPFEKRELKKMALHHLHHSQLSNFSYLAATQGIRNAALESLRKLSDMDHDIKQEDHFDPVKFSEEDFCKLATFATSGMHQSTSFIPTGDWIVLKRYEEKNYYLCLAIHEEDDKEIMERIKPCYEQFPELLTKI